MQLLDLLIASEYWSPACLKALKAVENQQIDGDHASGKKFIYMLSAKHARLVLCADHRRSGGHILAVLILLGHPVLFAHSYLYKK